MADLAGDVSALLRSEGRLIRAEVTEAGRRLASGGELIAAGIVLILVAALVLVQALVLALTFRQVAEEVGQYVHADDARAALDGVAQQMRRNRAAIALIAAGLGWLAFAGRRDSEHESGDRYRWEDDADPWERRHGADKVLDFQIEIANGAALKGSDFLL